MLRLPYGVSDYKKIREDNYLYIDKTKYLSELESEGDVLVSLAPSRFGKSLFTSMMYYYYDVNSKRVFKDLFKDTYVMENNTKGKNNYYMLRFDFSNIVVGNKNALELEREFLKKIADGIRKFNVDYGVSADSLIDNTNPSSLLLDFFSYFRSLDLEHKLYIIIDDYDSFLNTLLLSRKGIFRSIVASDGFINSFYLVIKEYCSLGIVDKVFITGESLITLKEIEGYYNTYIDISCDKKFSGMMGFSIDDINKLLDSYDKEIRDKLYKVIIDNYYGYNMGSDNKYFNPLMIIEFMREYDKSNRISTGILRGSSFNYLQLETILNLDNKKYYNEIMESLLKTGSIMGKANNRLNINGEYTKNDIISLLYYFGYLTVKEECFGGSILYEVPNNAIKGLYVEYFWKVLRELGVIFDSNSVNEVFKDIVLEGSINKLSHYVEEVLKYVDNKIFMKVDEAFVKLIYFVLLNGNSEFFVYRDYKCGTGEVDIMLFKNILMCKNDIMIEIRSLSSKERISKKLTEKIKKNAEPELVGCQEDEFIDKENLRKYVVIFSGSNLVGIEELI